MQNLTSKAKTASFVYRCIECLWIIISNCSKTRFRSDVKHHRCIV